MIAQVPIIGSTVAAAVDTGSTVMIGTLICKAVIVEKIARHPRAVGPRIPG
jgi:hypothetical protein